MEQVKEFNVSPVEQELAFNKWCRVNEIEQILLDADDTQWKTSPIFVRQEKKVCELLAGQYIEKRKYWKDVVSGISDDIFEKHGVNPDRWGILTEQLKDYGVGEKTRQDVKNLFLDIYQIPPKFISGAEAGLTFLKKTDTPFGTVTHANQKWTWNKYQWLGLNRFLNWDDIFIVDENGQKNKDSWQQSMDYFNVSPNHCLVVGDSPRTDINPACELGVNHCFLLRNSYNLWSVHQQPVDESKTRMIKSINELRWLGGEIVRRK